MKAKSTKKFSSRTTNLILLILILFVGTILRLYQFNASIADTASKEQSKSLIVATNISKNGSLIGRYTLSHLERKLLNTNNLEYNPTRLLLFERSVVFVSRISGLTFTQSGRLINIGSFLMIVAVLFLITVRYHSRIVAVATAGFLSFSPYAIFISRQVTPSILPLTLIMLGVLFAYLFSITNKKRHFQTAYYLTSLLFTSLAVASYPQYIVFLLPILYLLYKKFGLDFFRTFYFMFFTVCSVILSLLINVTEGTLPELIPLPIWSSQLGYIEDQQKSLLLEKSYLISIIKERIVNIILGSLGVGFVIIGILKKNVKTHLSHWFFVSALISFILFNKEHYNYLSLLIVALPAIAYYLGIGINTILTNKNSYSNMVLSHLMLMCIILLTIFFSWQEIKPLYHTDIGKIQLSQIISTLTKPTDFIATDTKGDPTMLYLSGRDGVPTTDNGDTELLQNGITHLVTSNPNYARDLSKKYPIIFKSEKAFILKLVP